MPRERTHWDGCWQAHADCAYERGRADERAKLSDEMLRIAGDPDVMSQWLNFHGLSGVSDSSAARVLSAYAGELDARLGGTPRCRHTSATPWGPSQCALPDGHDGRHAVVPSEASDDKEANHAT